MNCIFRTGCKNSAHCARHGFCAGNDCPVAARQAAPPSSKDVSPSAENPSPELQQVWVNHIPFLLSPIVASEIERLRKAVETTDDSAAFAEFANYIAREMPEGTVIGDPAWWAPRLWRFARYAKSLRTPTGESSPSETTRELVAESPQGCASESPSPLKAAAEHQGMTFECATCRATVTLSFTDQSKRSLDIRNLAGWNAAPNGVWCPQCSKTKGYVLGYLNSGPLPSPSTPSTRPDPLADVRWICEHCTTVNGIDDEKCLGCRKPRSQVKTSREPGYMGDINGPGCDPDVP